MASARVVLTFNPFKARQLGFGLFYQDRRAISSASKLTKKLYCMALSEVSPTLPMDGCTPISLHQLPNVMLSRVWLVNRSHNLALLHRLRLIHTPALFRLQCPESCLFERSLQKSPRAYSGSQPSPKKPPLQSGSNHPPTWRWLKSNAPLGP